ncbi:phosphoribosylanthranilate isomerase [Hirschia litorea]|uniref:N-(5'-phosphoribosyl)anthranilate isomerase n=1 Tax=Hirschia litorea TaxID=1199156 RepID=A0ABW2IL19_9PROT
MNTVKICGLKQEAMIETAIDAGADHVGFVHFPKSPRHLELARIEELAHFVGKKAFSWVVLAKPSVELLLKIAQDLPSVAGIQVHGALDADMLAQVRAVRHDLKIMRAYSVSLTGDLPTQEEMRCYDYVLFDAKPKADDKLPGGNGTRFNWEIMQGFRAPVPWFLAGGLDAENVQIAISQSGAKMVDVSSGVEAQPGVKDEKKVEAFIKAARFE